MFQLSLSTSLTPLATPGAGVSPAPTAAFSAALAGATGAIEPPPTGEMAAAAPRQAPAETGKTLPIATDMGDVLAWLDAGETQASAQPTGFGILQTDPGAPPTADAGRGQPVDPNAAETPVVPMPAVAAIPPVVVTSVVIANASAPADDDAGAGGTAATAETSVTPIAADIQASAPVFPAKTAAGRPDTKAKDHDRAALRSEPATASIILAANTPGIIVVAAAPPIDYPAAAPTPPKPTASPVIAAPVSSSVSTSRNTADAVVRVPSPSDAKTLTATPQADVALASAIATNDEAAPGSAPAAAPITEVIAAVDVADNGVVTLPVSGLVRRPVDGKQSLAPQPMTSSQITAPSPAAVTQIAAHDAKPVATAPAPESVVVASSATSETAPTVEPPIMPTTETPATIDTRFQVPASPAKSEDRRESAIHVEHTIVPTVRDMAVSPAATTTPASASVAAIATVPPTAAPSPEHPSELVSPAALVTATSDAAPAARPALQTRLSAAIDPGPASHAVPTATDPRMAPVAPPPVTTPTPPQSAGMMFGIAVGAPLLDRRPADRSSPRDEALQALTSLAASGSAAPIAAAGGAQQSALDMHRDDWPQAMIDRIEALRDAADATSTRITLAPDALGKVDLSIRHDGDAVHVHFAAEAAQTRGILVDAQPKLAELAQARGLKLGQATVDAGAGGQGQRQQPTATPAQPQRPASAFTRAAADDSAAATDSIRLA